MRIAIPLLSITTPVGVIWGLAEAYRFRPWLAGLMFSLLAVIGGFAWMTVRQIRRERKASLQQRDPLSQSQIIRLNEWISILT